MFLQLQDLLMLPADREAYLILEACQVARFVKQTVAYRLSETTSPPKRSRQPPCEQCTSSYLLCVSRFIVVILISNSDPVVMWTAWADSSFRTHCM
ncbi:hypothetical protein Y032_0644g1079 [Ancylostoma ceylanicum]|uniref:Uncharacterized protein n=1 Tax=Ancylostoma ceylanicum TaxID=53326 RepID=A0A016WK88_9BILA|nr:hypothetical protein Y032_0644g1079 [Ancylostoma ceylanicum]